MIPKFRAWMKSLKWMCDVTNISFDSKFVDICQQGDTERYTEMSESLTKSNLCNQQAFLTEMEKRFLRRISLITKAEKQLSNGTVLMQVLFIDL